MQGVARLKLFIAILLAAVIGLGYMAFRDSFEAPVSQLAETPKPVGTESAATSTQRSPALTPPAPGASTEEMKAYSDIVIAAAVKASNVSIASCSANPAVISVKKGSAITVWNPDPVAHTISFGGMSSYTIDAKSSKPISADFGKGLGIYGFGCDNSAGAAGMIILSE